MVAMPAPVSVDLRGRVFEARRAGESTAEVAERFDVCPAFVRRLLQRFRETGSLAPKSGRRGPKLSLAAHAERIRELNARRPDLTAEEIRRQLGLTCSALTVWRMLRRLGLTFKKSRSGPPNRIARTSKRHGTTGRGSSPAGGRGG
jgi:transposase